MANPNFGRIFSTTGAKTAIGDPDYAGGWDDIVGALPPQKDDFNSISAEQDEKLAFLNTTKAQTWTDSGLVNAYVVDITDSFAFDLFDGFQLSFTPLLANTGASTINGPWANGVKAIKDAAGADVSAGDLVGTIQLIYDSAGGWFKINSANTHEHDAGQITSGTLAVARGGTGVTTSTGTGNTVRSASPALSGNPTAPTQTAGNNSTRLATTAFVQTSAGIDRIVSQGVNGNGLYRVWGSGFREIWMTSAVISISNTIYNSVTVNYPVNFVSPPTKYAQSLELQDSTGTGYTAASTLHSIGTSSTQAAVKKPNIDGSFRVQIYMAGY